MVHGGTSDSVVHELRREHVRGNPRKTTSSSKRTRTGGAPARDQCPAPAIHPDRACSQRPAPRTGIASSGDMNPDSASTTSLGHRTHAFFGLFVRCESSSTEDTNTTPQPPRSGFLVVVLLV